MVVSSFQRSLSVLALSGLAGLSLLGTGCLDRELKPLNPCLVSGVVDKISVQNVDKVDLLFVVDNSGSMREEQASLRMQFPRIINTLTTGVRADGTSFPAVRDLHLGVVSTDMGLPGVPGRLGLGCGDESRPLGDDGILQHVPNAIGAQGLSCQANYQPFLAFQLGASNAMQIASDFSCIASLGTQGCGFEMQLESTLRALWPSDNILPNGMPGAFAPDGRPFKDNTMFGKSGPNGPNTGFVRNNVAEGLSLIAVIIVSDEEDCSSHNMTHFVPRENLLDGDPLRDVGLNLRCFDQSMRSGGEAARDNGAGNLYATTRYAQALKALRPNQENLVVFAGIVGVPTDLVEPEDPTRLPDFTNPQARDAFYDSLLLDPRLIETPDPNTLTGNPNLIPSCLRNIPGSDMPQKAFPPRRFIKVAKEFGENATIQSICSDDFTPAVNQIIDIIARQLGSVCLPRKLAPDSDGRVNCDIIWELPLPGTAPASTPTNCAQRMDILDFPDADRPQESGERRPLCVVKQVSVTDCVNGSSPACINGRMPNQSPTDNMGQPANVNGWYYDDFSAEVANCPAVSKQRIAFTNNPGIDAQPPSGVTVRLECLQEAASLTVPRNDASPVQMMRPSIGTACENDDGCAVLMLNPAECAEGRPYRFDKTTAPPAVVLSGCFDTQMFCHPQQRVCVVGCENKSECLPSFECDKRLETLMGTADAEHPQGRAVCVNPTCGD